MWQQSELPRGPCCSLSSNAELVQQELANNTGLVFTRSRINFMPRAVFTRVEDKTKGPWNTARPPISSVSLFTNVTRGNAFIHWWRAKVNRSFSNKPNIPTSVYVIQQTRGSTLVLLNPKYPPPHTSLPKQGFATFDQCVHLRLFQRKSP
jgi:hypothetical protein